MSEPAAPLAGPDLSLGVPFASVPENGILLGHAEGVPVLLSRSGGEVSAVAATCTHYGGPLAEGLVVGETVRCPWHHACFSLRTGEALGAPALRALDRWTVERRGPDVVVRGKAPALPVRRRASAADPANVVILGAGAAGSAAAEMLRRQGYGGGITLVDATPEGPVDRPNLSKDYLAGTAPEEWIPLFSDQWFTDHRVMRRFDTRAVSLDTRGRKVRLSDGSDVPYERLLLATGADAARLPIPGADLPNVHTLRSFADSRRLIASARRSRSAVIVGAGFIGLEVAASLRARGLEVAVVAPDARPLQLQLGTELGAFVRKVHEEHGVTFRLRSTVESLAPDGVALTGGDRVPGDLVILGVGARPASALAAAAGLPVDGGILVNEFLETGVPGVYAAGDVASWPHEDGRRLRSEHWLVAQRMGQTAARNLLGAREAFRTVPFFWSQHYDATIAVVGDTTACDRVVLRGDLAARDALVAYYRKGRVAAIATVGRDRISLEAEAAFERGEQEALRALAG